jgi:hypothetical protein
MYQNQILQVSSAASNSGQSRAERALDIAVTVAALRMQGVEPISEFFGIADRYVAGDFSLDQFTAAVEGLRSRRRPN